MLDCTLSEGTNLWNEQNCFIVMDVNVLLCIISCLIFAKDVWIIWISNS
jgi:hypothetical protein